MKFRKIIFPFLICSSLMIPFSYVVGCSKPAEESMFSLSSVSGSLTIGTQNTATFTVTKTGNINLNDLNYTPTAGLKIDWDSVTNEGQERVGTISLNGCNTPNTYSIPITCVGSQSKSVSVVVNPAATPDSLSISSIIGELNLGSQSDSVIFVVTKTGDGVDLENIVANPTAGLATDWGPITEDGTQITGTVSLGDCDTDGTYQIPITCSSLETTINVKVNPAPIPTISLSELNGYLILSDSNFTLDFTVSQTNNADLENLDFTSNNGLHVDFSGDGNTRTGTVSLGSCNTEGDYTITITCPYCAPQNLSVRVLGTEKIITVSPVSNEMILGTDEITATFTVTGYNDAVLNSLGISTLSGLTVAWGDVTDNGTKRIGTIHISDCNAASDGYNMDITCTDCTTQSITVKVGQATFISSSSPITYNQKVYSDDGQEIDETLPACINLRSISTNGVSFFLISSAITTPIFIPSDFSANIQCLSTGSITANAEYGIIVGNDKTTALTQSGDLTIQKSTISLINADDEPCILFGNSIVGTPKINILDNSISTSSSSSTAACVYFLGTISDESEVLIFNNNFSISNQTNNLSFCLFFQNIVDDASLIILQNNFSSAASVSYSVYFGNNISDQVSIEITKNQTLTTFLSAIFFVGNISSSSHIVVIKNVLNVSSTNNTVYCLEFSKEISGTSTITISDNTLTAISQTKSAYGIFFTAMTNSSQITISKNNIQVQAYLISSVIYTFSTIANSSSVFIVDNDISSFSHSTQDSSVVYCICFTSIIGSSTVNVLRNIITSIDDTTVVSSYGIRVTGIISGTSSVVFSDNMIYDPDGRAICFSSEVSLTSSTKTLDIANNIIYSRNAISFVGDISKQSVVNITSNTISSMTSSSYPPLALHFSGVISENSVINISSNVISSISTYVTGNNSYGIWFDGASSTITTGNTQIKIISNIVSTFSSNGTVACGLRFESEIPLNSTITISDNGFSSSGATYSAGIYFEGDITGQVSNGNVKNLFFAGHGSGISVTPGTDPVTPSYLFSNNDSGKAAGTGQFTNPFVFVQKDWRDDSFKLCYPATLYNSSTTTGQKELLLQMLTAYYSSSTNTSCAEFINGLITQLS